MNFDYIFWEDIPKEEFIIQQTENTGSEAILTFSRDENYRLICNIKTPPGYHAGWDNNFGKGRKAGELFSDIRKIEAITRHGHLMAKVEIFSTSWKSWSPKEIIYEIEAQKIALHRKINSNNDDRTIEYFFLSNMSKGRIHFPSSISFETSGKAKIRMADTIDDTIEIPMLSSYSYGCFKMEINGKKFILGKVDKKDINGVFLRFERENFPTDSELLIIKTFLGYITGSEIIEIGYTKFGQNYSINEQVFISTFRNDIKAIICEIPMPVIPLDLKIVGNRGVVITGEDKLTTLLSKYAGKRDTFYLDYIFYYIKCFRRVSMDIQMQPLATALDIIQKAYFKNGDSHSKGRYLDDDEFKGIILKYSALINSDLNGCPHKDRIVAKINRANEFTLNDRCDIFFTEIGLKIGEFEKEVIRQRHRSIHGDLGNTDYQKLLFLVNGAYALLNRIILKLIEYEGGYIDYSTYDYPIRNIEEPLGGIVINESKQQSS